MRNTLLGFSILLAGVVTANAQGSISGAWQVGEMGGTSWSLVLDAQGGMVGGVVSQAVDPARATVTKQSMIYGGTIQGDQISFKATSPDGDRTVTFTGKLNGSRLEFTRKVDVRPGGDPGDAGIFGVAGPATFMATRAPGAIFGVAGGVPAPSSSAALPGAISVGGHAGEVYKIGGGVSAPIPTYQPEPEYSEQARAAKIDGMVRISLVVDAQGMPRDIVATRPVGFGLDEKALEAVSRWRFKPGLKDGQPVAVQATIEVGFHLMTKPPGQQ